jgi:acetyl-CoA carboxylase biotin carboxyl carrier protein
MIDIRKLKELVRLMVVHDLTEVDLRDSEEQVTLRRQGAGVVVTPALATAAYSAHHGSGTALAEAPPRMAAGPGDGAAPGSVDVEDEEDLVRIESPMVGTFYASANPDAPPFVSVGAAVGPETVVCLIEAMKIFNEITADCAGVITEILVENQQPVEYGQVLFKVDPTG